MQKKALYTVTSYLVPHNINTDLYTKLKDIASITTWLNQQFLNKFVYNKKCLNYKSGMCSKFEYMITENSEV